jgi:myo-inositol-1(or 4)-monophosphatase
MPTALDGRFETAVELATAAGALALQLRPPPGSGHAILKGTQDWLTEADGAVEHLLSERLAQAFPEDGFQGEEGGIAREGRLRWVVDPIDGTSNYARGSARFCVSLALLEDRTPLIGVIVAPALGETITARLGGGATLNGVAIHAAATTDPAKAIIEVGWSHRCPNQAYLALCEHLLSLGASLRHGGSGALGLVDVAVGRSDGYAELHINLWDVAAALVILQEAGAPTSRFLDGNGMRNGNPILACAPGLAAALAALPGIPSAAA